MPCSQPAPVEDEFGRVTIFVDYNAVACLKTDSTYKAKYFNNKDSALAFMKRGRADSVILSRAESIDFGLFDGRLCCFKLDTMQLNPPGFRNSQIKRK